ncbi:adenylate/guanylate cyclase domain-containing protein [Haloferula sp.]|uniref:adenylate/guanylate cyclase domain-containing protein n=1 Tax=Haloferula sp. TaxID=2497595 RepID=UPI00329FE204
MSSNIQALLQRDVEQLSPQADEFAKCFYRHLFLDAPELRPLFEGVDMGSQGQMLFQALGLVVGSLNNFDEFTPVLENLGYRHVEYGVEKGHYPLAVDALISALSDCFGDGFTEERQQVWRDTLTCVTETMVGGIDKVAESLDEKRNTEREDFSPVAAATDGYLARFLSVEGGRDEGLSTEPTEEHLAKKFDVEFHGEKNVEAAPLQTVYQVAMSNGIAHIAECGGKAKCTTCRVMILEGLENCLPRNTPEREMAQLKGFAPEVRLACQTRVVGPVRCRRLVLDKADASEAHEGGVNSAGREIPLAVMFADIRGFTKLSGEHLPYDIVHALNRYFRIVCEEIDQREGYIDKYIGDGLMVLFGLSSDRKVHPCVDAVHAAVAMQRRMPELNEYLLNHLQMEFSIGVGIHFGPVVVGELGFPPKKQFTAIGDVVNVSARIEVQCKKLGTGILVSETVREFLTDDEFSIGPPIEVSLAGKEAAVLVHSVEELSEE